MKGSIWQVRTVGRWLAEWHARRGDFIVDTAPGDPGVDPEVRYVLVRKIGPEVERYLLVRSLGHPGAITGQVLWEIAEGHLEQVDGLAPAAEPPLRLIDGEAASA